MRSGSAGVELRGAPGPGSPPPADYLLFSEVLMQRPVRLGQLWRSHLLSREEAAYMQTMAQEHFEAVMGVLKALPRPMLLVLRNVNTVRAINTALGTPVDRYFLMAKRWVPAGQGPGEAAGARREAVARAGPAQADLYLWAARSGAGAAWQGRRTRASTGPASCATSRSSGRCSSLKWP